MSTMPVATVNVPSLFEPAQVAAAGSLPPGQTPSDDAHALALGQGRAARHSGCAPAASRTSPAAESRPGLAVDHGVALGDEVAAAQLDGVDAGVFGELVDERLDGE